MCILVFVYLTSMVYLMLAWRKALMSSPISDHLHETKQLTLTALIPFRNEETTLPLLLQDFLDMKGPITELRIILIDDFSTDGTVNVVSNWLSTALDLKLVTSKGKGKVAALNTGLALVQTDYIITLDADIRLDSDWYNTIVHEVGRDLDMCILPVLGISADSFASAYAQFDFMSLIGVTFSMAAMGRPVMANAAQLLIKSNKAAWQSDIVSGDDVLALHDLKVIGGEVAYSLRRELIARTNMPRDWKGVWSQRLRWASKAKKYRDSDTLVLGWIVLSVNVGLWVLFVFSLIHPPALFLFLVMLSTKAIIDFLFVLPVMRWFGQCERMFLFPLFFLINVIQYPLVFVGGLISGFTWKDRDYSL